MGAGTTDITKLGKIIRILLGQDEERGRGEGENIAIKAQKARE